MLRTKIIVLLILLLLIPNILTAQQKDIIGYFLASRWSERDFLLTQKSIPYEKLTIINYAFFFPDSNGNLLGRAPEAVSYLLNDEPDPLTGKPQPNTSLIDYAERAGVKVMLSLGGWEDSGNFPAIAANPEKRALFAGSCVNVIKMYGFHGIDIDWEFPGMEGHNGTPADKRNFTIMLQEVRDSLDAYGSNTGEYYPLSIAASSNPSTCEDMEVKKIAEILDFINIMTYDFNGPWSPTSGHNAPLYTTKKATSPYSVDTAFRLFHETYDIPAEKLNLGAAFYGRTYAGCRKLYRPHVGVSTMFHEEGHVQYYMLDNLDKRFKRKWDKQAKVPYLVNKKKNILVSYDDEKSIGYKADYILEKQARGVIIWTIGGDFTDDGQTPLLDVLHDKLGQ